MIFVVNRIPKVFEEKGIHFDNPTSQFALLSLIIPLKTSPHGLFLAAPSVLSLYYPGIGAIQLMYPIWIFILTLHTLQGTLLFYDCIKSNMETQFGITVSKKLFKRWTVNYKCEVDKINNSRK